MQKLKNFRRRYDNERSFPSTVASCDTCNAEVNIYPPKNIATIYYTCNCDNYIHTFSSFYYLLAIHLIQNKDAPLPGGVDVIRLLYIIWVLLAISINLLCIFFSSKYLTST